MPKRKLAAFGNSTIGEHRLKAGEELSVELPYGGSLTVCVVADTLEIRTSVGSLCVRPQEPEAVAVEVIIDSQP